MVGRLFPKAIDNDYRGSWFALAFFLPVLALKATIGFNISGLNPTLTTERILKSADGVPLDAFPAEAVRQVVFSSASWGFVMLLFSLLALLALVRYRAMLPLVILLFAAEQLGRKAIGASVFDAPDPGAPLALGFYINWGFTIAIVLAFVLSLVPRKR